MGRPRKRRREEAGDTEDMDGNMGAFFGAADVVQGDSDLATFSGDEPGLRTDSSSFFGNSLEAYEIVPFGSGNGSRLSDGESFSFEYPEGLVSNFKQGFPGWDAPQNIGRPFSTFANAPLQLQTPPNNSDELHSNNNAAVNPVVGCSCLSDIYSMLVKFQSLPEPSFPHSMGALRSAANLSRRFFACRDCSEAYNTALQNYMLLGTLLQLVINEYANLLKYIDTKSAEPGKITFRFADPSLLFDSRHTGLPDCPMAINVDLSGDEWRTLARKAIAQEVIGSSQGSRGLIALVQDLKDRQTPWHKRCSNRQCTAFHSADHQQNAETPDRLCAQIMYIDSLKRSVETLGL